jgi:hypothetical protein
MVADRKKTDNEKTAYGKDAYEKNVYAYDKTPTNITSSLSLKMDNSRNQEKCR